MPSCPSSVCPSVRPSGLRGMRGLSQKRFSNFSSFLLNRSKGHFSRSETSNLALFAHI